MTLHELLDLIWYLTIPTSGSVLILSIRTKLPTIMLIAAGIVYAIGTAASIYDTILKKKAKAKRPRPIIL